jgi:hypothetical protein
MRAFRALALTLLLLAGVCCVAAAQAQVPATLATGGAVPRLIRFSGTLGASDAPLWSTTASMTFALYTDQTGGAPLWQEVQNVSLDAAGRYDVLLGVNSRNGVPMELFTSNEARWLGVQVEGEAEQARVLLVAVPYALKAGAAETVGGHPVSDFVLSAATDGSSGSTTASTTGGLGTTKKSTNAPASTSTAVTTNSGTQNFLAKFDATGTNLVNASLYDNGFVGIGTVTPSFNLDVVGGIQAQASAFPQINFKQTGGAGSVLQEWRYQINPDGSYRIYDITGGIVPRFVLTQAGSIGLGTTAPAFNLDVVGGIQAQAASFPQINFKQTGGGGSVAQEWRYQINPDGSYRIYDITGGVVPRFVLTQAGKIGIGTTTPTFNLDVVGGMQAQSASFPQINFKQTGGAGSLAQEWRYQINPDGSYRIYDMTAGAVSRFVLTQAGNVGIGTTSPGQQLEVAGNVKLSGTGNGVIFPDGTMRTSATSINGTLSVSGSVQITAPGNGITVRSPDGTRCAQIGIDNTGSLATVAVPCPLPLAITTTSLPNDAVGTAYDQPIQTSGGDGTGITFALANSTTLPAWASLNPSTGHITGTPAAGDVGTSAPFQISATQTGNTVTSGNLTITVLASNCTGAPTGHESMLNGQYAFLVQGSATPSASPVAIAASFHADGAGNVTGGDFDINNAAGATYATINASSYTVGLDSTSSGNLGCVSLSLSNGSTTVFRFSLGGLRSGVFSKGRIIEYDDATGTGTRGSGVLLRQDTTSFALSHLQPRYAYGVDGLDYYNYHFASVGSFTVDTSGNISNAFADTFDGYTELGGTTSGGTGTINAISSTTGRATMTLTVGGHTTHQAIYMVNADEFFMIGTDPLSSVPIYSGRAIVTASSFSQASLSGNYIMHTTSTSAGLCMQLSGGFKFYVPCTNVRLWLVNANSGALSGTLYFYTPSPAYMVPSPFSGETYAVDATSGRTTISCADCVGPVFYIATPTATTEPISAFVEGPTIDADFGFMEFQPSATYSTSGMAGKYLYATEDPADYTVLNETGVATLSPGGTVTGSEYDSGDSGLGTSSPSGTMSIGSDGSGSWQYTYGNGCTSNNVAITNGTKVFVISHGGGYCNAWPQFPNAVVTVFERQ